MVGNKFGYLLPVLFPLALSACGRPSPVEVPMEEAHTIIPDEELRSLKEKAGKGDHGALNILIYNYYLVNFGESHPETIYWMMQAVRFGDCKVWNDLMFGVVEEGTKIPPKFFRPGETLEAMGKVAGCAPYVSIESEREMRRQAW